MATVRKLQKRLVLSAFGRGYIATGTTARGERVRGLVFPWRAVAELDARVQRRVTRRKWSVHKVRSEHHRPRFIAVGGAAPPA